MDRVPVLVLGDSPSVTGGLARIARDITSMLWQEQDSLGIEVSQAGIKYDGSPWPWRVWPINDDANWGKGDFDVVWGWAAGGKPGVVLSVWDPARCWELTEWKTKRERNKRTKVEDCSPSPELWGYFAVDSEREGGGFGGPAAEAVQRYERVLGYCGWGFSVLKKVMQEGKDLRWLPHGIDTKKWNAGMVSWQPETRLLGCVAANQQRKDFPLLFQAASELRKLPGWDSLRIWLHTDFETKYWCVAELAEAYGWNGTSLMVTSGISDDTLADLYGSCSVTLGIGSGEGFGYPLVESLAAGTPVVHGNFAGGAEIIPREEWLVESIADRIDGIYALKRPIYIAEEVAKALAKAGEYKESQECVGYCQGAVAHLDWSSLWPRWRSWIKAGLKGIRGE